MKKSNKTLASFQNRVCNLTYFWTGFQPIPSHRLPKPWDLVKHLCSPAVRGNASLFTATPSLEQAFGRGMGLSLQRHRRLSKHHFSHVGSTLQQKRRVVRIAPPCDALLHLGRQPNCQLVCATDLTAEDVTLRTFAANDTMSNRVAPSNAEPATTLASAPLLTKSPTRITMQP